MYYELLFSDIMGLVVLGIVIGFFWRDIIGPGSKRHKDE